MIYRRPTMATKRLTAPGGAQVPLAQVATITLRTGESTITREMNHRNLTIRIDRADRDLVSYLAED
jgi:heavy metal efflux system protein